MTISKHAYDESDYLGKAENEDFLELLPLLHFTGWDENFSIY